VIADDYSARKLQHYNQVRQRLQDLGVTWYGLYRIEGRYLPDIIHPNEHIGGVVYGHFFGGFAMLVATERRMIFLDNKIFYVNEDEINYDAVRGIGMTQDLLTSTVTLHTNIQEYTIRTLNSRCATGFVRYVESRSVEHSKR
jgi:hypothetical protein